MSRPNGSGPSPQSAHDDRAGPDGTRSAGCRHLAGGPGEAASRSVGTPHGGQRVAAHPVPAIAESTDRLLTIPEVATRLGVPTAYAYELARRRQLPVLRVGLRYLRVSAAGLATWIERLDDRGARRHSRGAAPRLGANAHVGAIRSSVLVDRDRVRAAGTDTASGLRARGSSTTRADRGGPPRDA